MATDIELLAPAGSVECLRAAVNAGADAVYMGSTRFGARALADNPDTASYLSAMDYAHLHGRKVYLTVNTLLKERETKELYAYLLPFYERGIDAVIVQDYGALLLIRKWFPDLLIFASTQMTVTGKRYAKQLKDMGVSRVILARELSLTEIRDIADSVDIELECFVHGALCYCYSGQCLMSSLIGGRSGNRGRCAQPCRLPYSAASEENSYLLSMKDLETLKILPDITDAGVSSLKIEGRMKSPRYTAGVVSIYRRYLDLLKDVGKDGYKVSQADLAQLGELFDRGGTTDGYLTGHNGKDMIALKEKPDFRETDAVYFSELDKEYVQCDLKIPVKGDLYIHEGEPVSLSVSDISKKDICVNVVGDIADSAKTQPLNADQARAQTEKTGNSLYNFEDLNIDIKGSCFLAVKELNELRRRALKAFEEKILSGYLRKAPLALENDTDIETHEEDSPFNPELHVSVEDIAQIDAALSFGKVSEVCIDSSLIDAALWEKITESVHGSGKKCALILPAIFRAEAEGYFTKHMEELKSSDFDEIIIRSLEEFGFLKEQGIDIPLAFDSNIYVWNRAAKEGFYSLGASRLTAPCELNSHELFDLGCEDMELIVYGHLPVMVTAQCVKRTISKCDKKPECLFMKDRTGRSFPVKNICRFCTNTIYNAVPLTLIGEEETVKKLSPKVLRLSFTTESPGEVRKIIRAYEEAFFKEGHVEIPFKEFTRGHFNRGVR